MYKRIEAYLWGDKGRFIYLWLAALLLLFIMLGAREIWTQEHRWADVVDYMLYSKDFLHPMLNGNEYYDKPLLSYWVIAGFAILTGDLSTWVLRLPSAMMGLVAVTSIYLLGCQLKNKRLGLLAGWMLLTTFYFIFWSRIASTDIMNLGGTLLAIAWYFLKRACPSFFNYFVFFVIVAVTALFKGLVAPVVVMIAVMMDIFLQKSWQQHFSQWRFYAALILASVVYLLPFWISAHFGGTGYHSNGLALVYRENITRYFHPFDHQDPFYVYLYYLPIYLLPWTVFFVPAAMSFKRNLSSQAKSALWMKGVMLGLFLFFTLSGSRRGYYVLPMVPFAILMAADWIIMNGERASRYAVNMTILFYLVFLGYNALFLPWFYRSGGVMTFREVLNKEVSKIHPLSDWSFSLLDAQTKLTFYLKCRPNVVNYGIVGLREAQTLESVQKTWKSLQAMPKNTIFVTRRLYEPILAPVFKDFILVESEPTYRERFFHKKDPEAPVAYVPKRFLPVG